MELLIIFAFIAGVITILSPCILPILPVVLSGSLGGGKKRPLGIVAGFILSFTFFTLALTSIVKATGVSPDILRLIAVVVIFVFGLSLLLPITQILLEKLTSRLLAVSPKAQNKSGFMGGLLIGFSLGLIWAPCVGPILASVITLALTSSVSTAAVFITLAYSLGTAIPMLAIMQGGRQLLQKVPWLLNNSAQIQKGFGVVMMLTAAAIYFNLDRQFQTAILTAFPQYGAGLTSIENNSLVQTQLDNLRGGEQRKQVNGLQSREQGIVAPNFEGGGEWINSEPLTLESLKGKVVLVDFWTYSCINCIRTFPHLRGWYNTYKDDNFVIIGVHAPEFEFEKSKANVQKAVTDFKLEYPIVQDNDFTIWHKYKNRFWPAHYLIDAEGKIRYTHFGEGKYEETEAAIRILLQEAGQTVTDENSVVMDETPRNKVSPETYLGLSRLERFASTPSPTNVGKQTFKLNESIPTNSFGFGGSWTVDQDYSMAEKGSTLETQFKGKKVFLVITPATPEDVITVSIDGKPLSTGAGNDVENSQIKVTEPRLYELYNSPDNAQDRRLKLEFLTPGTQVFAFTFG